MSDIINKPGRAVTVGYLAKVLQLAGKGINEILTARLLALERRIMELESKPMLKYAGTWRSGETYPEGRLITHQGGLWLSTETTSGTPGTDASGFRLIVKKGHA